MENNRNKNKILLYYKYVKIEDPEILRKEQYDLCKTLEMKGRIIVAKEGINGTLEGSEAFCNAYMNHMKADPRFSDIHWKISDGTPDGTAFPRLSVKARKEIVSLHLGEEDFDPNETTGVHLKPEELHKWYQEGKEFNIVDMRNDYELLVGKFENTIFPGMRNFRDLRKDLKKIKELKDKPVLTVCTGGVRCEKASGLLLKEGFKEVYQLDGGIVSYMNKYPGKNFLGSLYVFDKRKVVHFNDEKSHKTIGICKKCHQKTEQYVNCANLTCHKHFLCCDACIDSDKVGKNGVILSYCSIWCKVKDLFNSILSKNLKYIPKRF